MLGPALLLTLLFLKGHQGQGSNPRGDFLETRKLANINSAEHVVGVSGARLQLQPLKIQTKNLHSVEWKRKRPPTSEISVILRWKHGSHCCKEENWTLKKFSKIFDFITEDLSLIIRSAQQQDSGFYLLEVTDTSGEVENRTFQVSVFDHVGKLDILQNQKVLYGGRCQVTLSCSVPRGGNVSYDWYRGSMLIETARNLSRLEEQIDANSSHIYTCNVSNSVSWVNHTFFQHCPSDAEQSKQDTFLLLLVTIVVLLITLFLGALTGFCVWRRKRKQSQAGPEELLTVYEDVNNVQIRRTQEQKPNPPGEGSTIYSTIQSPSPASTSQEPSTLYALVQPSRKSESKKKNHRSSLNNTIYEEVGKRQLKAQNPARLSRRELENFCVYS